jgi:hypothetical protein
VPAIKFVLVCELLMHSKCVATFVYSLQSERYICCLTWPQFADSIRDTNRTESSVAEATVVPSWPRCAIRNSHKRLKQRRMCLSLLYRLGCVSAVLACLHPSHSLGCLCSFICPFNSLIWEIWEICLHRHNPHSQTSF